MTKEEFLKQLKESIHVLDDQEQQYFVEEYTQHIDMKMSQGMTEDEAVREIGSIDELSKEILESYHVKADFAENTPQKKLNYGKICGKVKRQTDKIYGKIAAGCKKIANSCKNALTGVIKRKRKPESAEVESTESMETEIRKMPRGRRIISGFIRLLKGLMALCGKLLRKGVYIVLWGLLFCWNVCAILCGLFGIFLTAITVFLIGIFLVMAVQGYPTVGLMVASIGATVLLGTITVLCFILTRWKTNKEETIKGGEAHA
jgi:hypothetical protein